MKEEIKYCHITAVSRVASCRMTEKPISLIDLQEIDKTCGNFATTEIKDQIGDLLNQKSSVFQLLDSFLFGSIDEQLVFEALCYKWNFDKFIKTKGRYEYLSELFHVNGYDLSAQLKFTIYSDGDVKLYLCFKDVSVMDLKLTPMVVFIFKFLSGHKHQKSIIRCYNYSFNYSLQYNQIYFMRGFVNKLQLNELIQAMDDGSAEVLVLVEPLSIINKISTDGIITETIRHYKEKLQMEKDSLIKYQWSPHFLTHPGGYRMTVWIYLNGYIGNDQTGLIVVTYFLSGKYDSQLPNQFQHELSFTLVHSSDATKNITVKKQSEHANGYRMVIASEGEILSRGFSTNNSLTYILKIKPTQ